MKLYPREQYLAKMRGFYHAPDLIKVITGVRRCGKSCLMETIAQELMESGIRQESIVYFDLDKKEYNKIVEAGQLDELIEKSSKAEGLKYLFIDEVQNVNGFEMVLNGYRATGEWSIFITGSNSYLLSGEIVTKLTGRYLEFEMFPLNFEEYEQMKTFYGKDISDSPAEELQRYILEGGFPRTRFLDNLNDKRTYVWGIVTEIFEKDIRKRIKIRNKATFETIRTYIINNFGATTSLKSLKKSLGQAGTPVSEATIAR